MATEKDFELLDDYLSNKLEGSEKAAFEQKLQSDASLRQEYKIQQHLVNGLKQARIAELKSMLNQTAIPPAYTGASVAIKLAAGILIAGTVGICTYLWMNNPTPLPPAAEEHAVTPDKTDSGTAPVESLSPKPADTQAEQTADSTVPAKPSAVTKTKKEEAKTTGTAIQQPNLHPYDPTTELETGSSAPVVTPHAKEETAPETPVKSSIQVETDNSNKKFGFHYQFKNDKLVLYGSFEKDLYTILEFNNNNKRTMFLYYNSSYYLLDEAQVKPTPLKAITDPALLQKLREYRSNS